MPGGFLAGAAGALADGDGGVEAACTGRSGGSSKLSFGKLVLSSQRASATSSTPVKPMCDLRTSDHSAGESAVISVAVLPSFGSTAIIHGSPAVLVVNCDLPAIMANSWARTRQLVNRVWVISQS